MKEEGGIRYVKNKVDEGAQKAIRETLEMAQKEQAKKKRNSEGEEKKDRLFELGRGFWNDSKILKVLEKEKPSKQLFFPGL